MNELSVYLSFMIIYVHIFYSLTCNDVIIAWVCTESNLPSRNPRTQHIVECCIPIIVLKCLICTSTHYLTHSTVKEAQTNGGDVQRRRKATLHRQTDALYRALVSDLIEGRPVQFPATDDGESGATTTRSAILGETLASLDEIATAQQTQTQDRLASEGHFSEASEDINEKTSTTPVNDAVMTERRRRRVQAIEVELQCDSLSGYIRMHLGGVTPIVVPEIANTYYEKRVLEDSRSGAMTPLTLTDVDDYFVAAEAATTTTPPDAVHVGADDAVLGQVKAALYRAVSGLDECCSLGDPSCMMNDLLVLEAMRRQDVECRFQRLQQNHDDSGQGGNTTRHHKSSIAT